MVIEIDGRNRRAQPSRGGNQRLSNARGHDTEAGGARLADSLKCAHDAPDRAKKPDERRDGGRRCQERHVTLELVHLDGRGAQESPVERIEAPKIRTWRGAARSALRGAVLA